VSKPEYLGAGFSSIVTRAELRMLEKQRAKPEAGLTCDMQGPTGDAVRVQTAERIEARVQELRTRLTQKRQELTVDYALGSLKGRARRDFGR
jgi:hypothetical protein